MVLNRTVKLKHLLKNLGKRFRYRRRRSAHPAWKWINVCTELIQGTWRSWMSRYYHFRYDPVLRKFIAGRTILIIGAGPSAGEIAAIPEDVLVFSCKRAIKILDSAHRSCDLYINWKRSFQVHPAALELLKMIKTNILLLDNPAWVQRCRGLKDAYRRFIPYVPQDTYYLKKLLNLRSLRQVPGRKKKSTSIGLKLLQYALFFQAKEIYLIGIDLTSTGYFWGEGNIQKHLEIDDYFLKRMAKLHHNIYSLSATSPITRYFPHKPFHA